MSQEQAISGTESRIAGKRAGTMVVARQRRQKKAAKAARTSVSELTEEGKQHNFLHNIKSSPSQSASLKRLDIQLKLQKAVSKHYRQLSVADHNQAMFAGRQLSRLASLKRQTWFRAKLACLTAALAFLAIEVGYWSGLQQEQQRLVQIQSSSNNNSTTLNLLPAGDELVAAWIIAELLKLAITILSIRLAFLNWHVWHTEQIIKQNKDPLNVDHRFGLVFWLELFACLLHIPPGFDLFMAGVDAYQVVCLVRLIFLFATIKHISSRSRAGNLLSRIANVSGFFFFPAFARVIGLLSLR